MMKKNSKTESQIQPIAENVSSSEFSFQLIVTENVSSSEFSFQLIVTIIIPVFVPG